MEDSVRIFPRETGLYRSHELFNSTLFPLRISSYLFGKSVRKYARFLKGAGIDEMPVWSSQDLGDKPFAMGLDFMGIANVSDLVFCTKRFNCLSRVRGIKEIV